MNTAIDAVRNVARKSISAQDQVVESNAQITSILTGIDSDDCKEDDDSDSDDNSDDDGCGDDDDSDFDKSDDDGDDDCFVVDDFVAYKNLHYHDYDYMILIPQL